MIQALTDVHKVYDVCVIGAGPAGLTIATQLAYSKLSVCVIESGDSERSDFADALRAVESEGLSIKIDSRERVVGGASATWNGLAAPLDEIDFEDRFGTAWPLTREELIPFMAKAVAYRFPHPGDFDAPETGPEGRMPWRNLTLKRFIGTRNPFRFGTLRYVFERPNLDLVLQATVSELISEAGSDGRRLVTAAACRTRDGRSAHVRAKTFVLATGGIENPRLLLNSPAGSTALGNHHDQVGRYFMNHPKGFVGRLHLARRLSPHSRLIDRTDGERLSYLGLRLSPEYQREHGLLNTYVGFEPFYPDDLIGRVDRLRKNVSSGGRLQRYVQPKVGRLWDMVEPRPKTLQLRWFADMEASPDNRVLLSAKRDALGVPMAVVRHDLGQQALATLRALHAMVAENVSRLGLGTLQGDADEVIRGVRIDASHHLGSTRMGVREVDSVVDSNCRVHGVNNLYAAGGSVFSTAGCANPTYTIIALAIRLADHLGADLDRASTPPRVSTVRPPKRLVLIGFGHRVRTDVVPALESIGEDVQIVDIYARSPGMIFGRSRAFPVTKLAGDRTLRSDDFNTVYIGVPPAALVDVLRRLPASSRSVNVILDTPAPIDGGVLKALRGFGRVSIAEDSVFLPWLELLRQFWHQHADDRPVTIECVKSVYRYHGVALVKVLCGAAASPAKVTAVTHLPDAVRLQVGQTQVTIVEPRDYATGVIRIKGRKTAVSSNREEGYDTLEIRRDGSRLIGFALGDLRSDLSESESQLVGAVGPDDTIVSLMHQLTRVGLARMLSSIADGNPGWSLAEAVDDLLVARRMRSGDQ